MSAEAPDEVSDVSGRSGPFELPDRGLLARGWNALLGVGATADEPSDQRLQRRLQVAMAAASVGFVGLWGATFLLVARADAAAQALGYCAGTVAMLVHLKVTRRYGLFASVHPLLVLCGPYALHLYLGGFAGSGGAVLWSLVAPVAAIMFVGGRASLLWVVMLPAMLVVGLARELMLPAPHALDPHVASFYFAFNTIGVVLFLFFSTRYFTDRIQVEQARADRLLLNILPAPIAERLKRRPGRIAERFPSVTVVFGDLVGFTGLSQRMQPRQLVNMLDAIFSAFDAAAAEHGLEKIKTIGDAYMVVAGVPEPCADHASRAARMALAMRQIIERFAAERVVSLQMRIGVHTGEVVAGVIGQRKFTYDLWGDTVNTASRMESHGEPGRIQVSAATREALGDAFRLTARGAISVKGKGEMQTFWLDG